MIGWSQCADSLNNQRDTRPVGPQQLNQGRIRDRAGESIAHIIVSVGDGGVRPRLLRQFALIVVDAVRDARGIRDAGPFAVCSQQVMIVRHDGIIAVAVYDVGQAVQRIVGVRCVLKTAPVEDVWVTDWRLPILS